MPPAPIYRTEDIRRIEAAASGLPLMQRAGRAAAELANSICTDRNAPILVLAGPGNNGGDAFEAARLLRERFFDTCVVFSGDVATLPTDAADAFQRFSAGGGRICASIPDGRRWSLIIDGLFGIGLKREIGGLHAALIEQANTLSRRDGSPLLALDCPSGLDADTGTRRGATIRASHTITFIAAKPGLFTADGPDFCGKVETAPLDIDTPGFAVHPGHCITLDDFRAQLQPRKLNSHKGSFGSAGILGGTAGMVGAVLLAARAALRLGSGRVYLGLIDEKAPPFDPAQPELMIRRPDRLLATDLSALGCGPGMGNNGEVIDLIENACSLDVPLVFDADALNRIAENGELHVALGARTAPTLLTPHPAEAARLLDCQTSDIQNDRLAAALELASRFDAHVALKGCGTVVATPDGRWFINTTGNPGLATAGSGDVLTGLATALLAQGWPPLDALLAAVHLHGCAADRLAANGIGPIGMTAGELIDSARTCFNEWIR
ncbi:MAG: NAD(P)H-hydrate dehydratase [Propionivibrio sp.]